MRRYEADDEGSDVGDKLSDGERNVGEVVNVSGRQLLAVTPVEMHEQALSADGRIATPKGASFLVVVPPIPR